MAAPRAGHLWGPRAPGAATRGGGPEQQAERGAQRVQTGGRPQQALTGVWLRAGGGLAHRLSQGNAPRRAPDRGLWQSTSMARSSGAARFESHPEREGSKVDDLNGDGGRLRRERCIRGDFAHGTRPDDDGVATIRCRPLRPCRRTSLAHRARELLRTPRCAASNERCGSLSVRARRRVEGHGLDHRPGPWVAPRPRHNVLPPAPGPNGRAEKGSGAGSAAGRDSAPVAPWARTGRGPPRPPQRRPLAPEGCRYRPRRSAPG